MRRLAKPAGARSIATNNSFGLLNDCSLDAEQGPANESRNAYGARFKMQRNGTVASASPPEVWRSARPPPLHTFNVKAKDTIKLLSDNGLSPDKFYIRPYSNGLVNINAVCSDSHSTVKKILDNSVVHSFTYTSRDKKTKSLVLKGISLKFTEDEVKADIESRNLSDINVIKVCVKCGQDHGTISEDPKSKLCCANCGSNGHPASYGGCPYLETVQSSVRRLKQLTRAVNRIKKTYLLTRFTLGFGAENHRELQHHSEKL
ncbi:hypothetical protein M0802_012382 [Mischocyttarus mexicanus]|nr:hypothetical protein M0802_012382 [Mischocyttarus mexicanus]